MFGINVVGGTDVVGKMVVGTGVVGLPHYKHCRFSSGKMVNSKYLMQGPASQTFLSRGRGIDSHRLRLLTLLVAL